MGRPVRQLNARGELKCPRCLIYKKPHLYYTDKRNSSGIKSDCKFCHNDRVRVIKQRLTNIYECSSCEILIDKLGKCDRCKRKYNPFTLRQPFGVATT